MARLSGLLSEESGMLGFGFGTWATFACGCWLLTPECANAASRRLTMAAPTRKYRLSIRRESEYACAGVEKFVGRRPSLISLETAEEVSSVASSGFRVGDAQSFVHRRIAMLSVGRSMP